MSERDHRALVPLPSASLGDVRVAIAASERQEAALVADTLRRAHLIDQVPWSSMAVLVRSAVRQVPGLQRALSSAGVPVAVAGDELPLADDPGTSPLLRLIGCALEPAGLTEEVAAELLTGPLGGTDALGLRRLHRLLRQRAPGEVAAVQPAGTQAMLGRPPRRRPSRSPGPRTSQGPSPRQGRSPRRRSSPSPGRSLLRSWIPGGYRRLGGSPGTR